MASCFVRVCSDDAVGRLQIASREIFKALTECCESLKNELYDFTVAECTTQEISFLLNVELVQPYECC